MLRFVKALLFLSSGKNTWYQTTVFKYQILQDGSQESLKFNFHNMRIRYISLHKDKIYVKTQFLF